MPALDHLDSVADRIRSEWTERNAVRDATLARSRELIRLCATVIRASHRDDFREAHSLLAEADKVGAAMREETAPYPDLFVAGYTQDALKEYVEAQVVYAFITGGELPTRTALGVEGAAYLKGLAEAASEMRRHALDLMRQNRLERTEEILAIMDEVYGQLMTVDFPDAITGGLRRTTDMLRGVVHRTRGDLTTAIRQEMMRQALRDFEARLGTGLPE